MIVDNTADVDDFSVENYNDDDLYRTNDVDPVPEYLVRRRGKLRWK